MADITNGVVGASTILTNIIFWITNFLGNVLNNIGATEIIIMLLIGVAIYFYFKQHELAPVRIAKF